MRHAGFLRDIVVPKSPDLPAVWVEYAPLRGIKHLRVDLGQDFWNSAGVSFRQWAETPRFMGRNSCSGGTSV
jgi:hypothetical protein